ncbi:SDR family oxidoreductase [Aeromicrobium sp. UC242_57]|uniref:SDR family oxidoreductase n=1 Tax=Aeromicrobium sp. UC242_57 TaxID=3374624 RepID=UPI0037A7F83C
MSGKVIVVTGAAGAIGRATVDVLAREGAVVVAVDIAPAEDLSVDLFVTCDLTDEQQVIGLYSDVMDRFGRIDGLFNNAGVALGDDGSFLDVECEVFMRTLRINVESVLLCCKHGIPHVVASGGGSVVNTSSLVASIGSAVSQIGYTASKGAVLAMSRELAVELARMGVRVNSLSPGPVESPLLDTLFTGEEVARRMVHVPTGRFSRANEIAEAAVFLLSDASSNITGTDLKVDGGITAAYVTPES